MKKTRLILLVFVLCCLMVLPAWAAKKVEFSKSNAKGFIALLNQQPMGQALGLENGESFELLKSHKDFNGVTHSRYLQTYNGIPVWGHQTVVSKGTTGKVLRLNGGLVKGIHADVNGVSKGLDAKAALLRMQADHKARDPEAKWFFRNEEFGTYIYIHEGKAYLAYVVSYFADTEAGNPSQPLYFIDVKNGKLIHTYNNLKDAVGTGPGGNVKVGYYYYGTDYPGFGVTESSGTCTMNTTNVKTVNLNHGTIGTTAYSYTCYENTFKEINDAYSPLNDAQYFGQVVYDVYQDWYGVPVLPFQLTLRCHYRTDYENAFWDGSTMTFGDGYTIFYPLVAVDVVAHEVSHGFTDYNSDLTYSGEPGGINESFSDMAGEASKYFMRGTNDFMCGYDIFKNPTGALRYLYDPPLDGRSIDHVDDYYTGMDVHYSSGIFNKAFYLLATTSGWTTRMAFDVFCKANIDYWTPSTTFQQGAEGAQAAADDYGYACEDVAAAFAQVGITLDCGGTGGGDMYVQNITQNIIRQGRNYRSNATVTIYNDSGSPVSGATVYITWSDAVSGTASGTTGTGGTVSFTSPKVKSTGPFTISVTNVTHSSYTYNSSLNVKTSDTQSY